MKLEQLKYLDLFGPRIELRLGRKKSHKTYCGACMTVFVIAWCLAACAFIGKDIISKDQPIILISQILNDLEGKQQQEQQNQVDKFGEFKEIDLSDLMLRIGIRDENGNSLDQSYQSSVQIKLLLLSKVNSIITSKTISLESCINSDMKSYSDNLNEDFSGSEYQCISKDDQVEFSLNGEPSESNSLYIQLQIQCISNCASLAAAHSTLKARILYRDKYFTPTDYNKPISDIFRDKLIDFSLASTGVIPGQQVVFPLQKITVSTDTGSIFTQNQFENFVSFLPLQQAVGQSLSLEAFVVQIHVIATRTVYQRSYMKLQSLLAAVGGLMKALMVIGAFIVKPISKLSLQSELVNELFIFEGQEKENRRKEFIWMNSVNSLNYEFNKEKAQGAIIASSPLHSQDISSYGYGVTPVNQEQRRKSNFSNSQGGGTERIKKDLKFTNKLQYIQQEQQSDCEQQTVMKEANQSPNVREEQQKHLKNDWLPCKYSLYDLYQNPKHGGYLQGNEVQDNLNNNFGLIKPPQKLEEDNIPNSKGKEQKYSDKLKSALQDEHKRRRGSCGNEPENYQDDDSSHADNNKRTLMRADTFQNKEFTFLKHQPVQEKPQIIKLGKVEDQYLFAGNDESKQDNDNNKDNDEDNRDEVHQDSHINYQCNKSVEKWNKFYNQDLVTRQFSKNMDQPIENNNINKLQKSDFIEQIRSLPKNLFLRQGTNLITKFLRRNYEVRKGKRTTTKKEQNEANQIFSNVLESVHEKPLKFSCWDYFRFYFGKFKCLAGKRKQIQFSVRKVTERLDIVYILQKLVEIDKLKVLLLSSEQHKLFEYMPKSCVGLDPDEQETKTQKKNSNIKKTWSLLQSERGNLDKFTEAFQAYKIISAKEEKEPLDERLIDMLDPEIKRYFDSTRLVKSNIQSPQIKNKEFASAEGLKKKKEFQKHQQTTKNGDLSSSIFRELKMNSKEAHPKARNNSFDGNDSIAGRRFSSSGRAFVDKEPETVSKQVSSSNGVFYYRGRPQALLSDQSSLKNEENDGMYGKEYGQDGVADGFDFIKTNTNKQLENIENSGKYSNEECYDIPNEENDHRISQNKAIQSMKTQQFHYLETPETKPISHDMISSQDRKSIVSPYFCGNSKGEGLKLIGSKDIPFLVLTDRSFHKNTVQGQFRSCNNCTEGDYNNTSQLRINQFTIDRQLQNIPNKANNTSFGTLPGLIVTSPQNKLQEQQYPPGFDELQLAQDRKLSTQQFGVLSFQDNSSKNNNASSWSSFQSIAEENKKSKPFEFTGIKATNPANFGEKHINSTQSKKIQSKPALPPQIFQWKKFTEKDAQILSPQQLCLNCEDEEVDFFNIISPKDQKLNESAEHLREIPVIQRFYSQRPQKLQKSNKTVSFNHKQLKKQQQHTQSEKTLPLQTQSRQQKLGQREYLRLLQQQQESKKETRNRQSPHSVSPKSQQNNNNNNLVSPYSRQQAFLKNRQHSTNNSINNNNNSNVSNNHAVLNNPRRFFNSSEKLEINSSKGILYNHKSHHGESPPQRLRNQVSIESLEQLQQKQYQLQRQQINNGYMNSTTHLDLRLVSEEAEEQEGALIRGESNESQPILKLLSRNDRSSSENRIKLLGRNININLAGDKKSLDSNTNNIIIKNNNNNINTFGSNSNIDSTPKLQLIKQQHQKEDDEEEIDMFRSPINN